MTKIKILSLIYTVCACISTALFFSTEAYADASARVIQLNPNFGKPIRLPESAATIAIGDPNIADVVTVEPDLLMITGQSNGSTSMTIIGRSGDIYQYTLLVANDVTQLKTLIYSVAPNVRVESLKGQVLLKGTVETAAQLARVLTIADRYMGGKGTSPRFNVVSDQGGVLAGGLTERQAQTVVPLTVQSGGGNRSGGRGRGTGSSNRLASTGKANLAQNIARASVVTVANGKVVSMIKVLNQPKVEIQMRIVEIDRAKTDKFGIDWRLDGNKVNIASLAGDVTGGTFPDSRRTSGTISPGTANLIGLFRPGDYGLAAFVRAMEEKGATSTLSEPLLTALSGEATQFMIGGSVPIPVQTQSSANNTVATATNVRYENFGLAISVRPTVLENGKINIVLDQTMSEIDYSSAIQIIGSQVPGFKQKTVSTVTESESGETWAVAGLLTEEDRRNLQSVPWISKVPMLGELFKNKDEAVSRNEMIILVNARRVDEPNSTTTNFNGRGKLEPKPNLGSVANNKANGQELDSDLHQIPHVKSAPRPNNKNIRSIEIIRDQPLKFDQKRRSSTDDSTPLPTMSIYKNKRSNHANVYRELNSTITNMSWVTVIHLKEKARKSMEKVAIDTSKSRLHTNKKLLNSELPLVKNTYKPSTKSTFNSLVPDNGEPKLDTQKLVHAVGQKLKQKHEYPRAKFVNNIRGVRMSLTDNPMTRKVVINNFLVGPERLAYLDKVKSQNLIDIGNSDIKQWRVASGSDKNMPHKEVLFLIKSPYKKRLYSGAEVNINKSTDQKYFVAVEHE